MSFYLGIPDEEWNLHLFEAEELLTEDNIGTHILGIYPYGDRIYGDESSAPGLLCVYFDEPSRLLNPCNDDMGQRNLSIGRGCGPVWFISLYRWAQLTCNLDLHQEEFYLNLCHIIPPMSAPLYEDPQLTVIMDLARDFLEASDWGELKYMPPKPKWPPTKIAAYLRAMLVLRNTSIFAPCINKNWCNNIIAIDNSWLRNPSSIQEYDHLLTSYYGGELENIPDSKLAILVREFQISLLLRKKRDVACKEREVLGMAVRDLYRSLL